MDRMKLSEHKFKKGKFITPINEIGGEKLYLTSWFKERLPEYIWMGLILQDYDKQIGLKIIHDIITQFIEIEPNYKDLKISSFLDLSDEKQQLFYNILKDNISTEVLSPLTLIYSFLDEPIFFKNFYNPDTSPEEKTQIINNLINKMADSKSPLALDIRFVIVYFYIQKGDLKLTTGVPQAIQSINDYFMTDYDDEKMKIIRPTISSIEMILSSTFDLEDRSEKNNNRINKFWEVISKMSDCELFFIPIDNPTENKEDYINSLNKIFEFLFDYQSKINPLDKKTLIMFGICSFSYKLLNEVVFHNLENTIIGRNLIRNMIESYINLKSLIYLENQGNPNIWEQFEEYGIGQFKTFSSRARDYTFDFSKSHVNIDYINFLINEEKDENFLNMDTRHFFDKSMRNKAMELNEKELFDFYYDYDSAYTHGLWGAIRESSLLKCNTPSHQYHKVIDIDNEQKLISIWHDCVFVMNKTINLLNTQLEIPERLLGELNSYEY